MFMSFSKTIAKVGGFRFGIRMRRTKSNSLWFFLALAFIYTCQLIWYSMVLSFWLMYAFLYGIFWCIKKPYVLLGKKLGKPKAAAIVAGFLAFLVLIGSCSNQSDDEPSATAPSPIETSTAENTTANTTSNINMSATEAVESWKTKSESFLVDAFDYYDIVADESGATISIATNGFAEVMETAKASGHNEKYESWANVRTSIIDMCNVFSDYAKSLGLTDYSISVVVLDDRNHDSMMLNVANGEISYDYMADAPDMTMGQKNALASARSYLGYSAFSHDGLIGQLEYEGYTTEEATFAADNCGADWNEQALEKALSYLDYSAFSYTGLISQLEFEKFTTEQATYGADNCGADWNEQAVKKAKSYLESSSFSKDDLIGQLVFEGFTQEQAIYGVEANGY